MSAVEAATPRLLVVPGLHGSPPEHWQSWLEREELSSVRVVQRDWAVPDVDRWAARVGSTLERVGRGPWLAVAHSFGVLAVLRHLVLQPRPPLQALLLVAPADPDRFGVGDLLPDGELPVPTTVVLSDNDPWLAFGAGQRWARRWGAACTSLGAAGHVNVAAGYRTLPFARQWIAAQRRRFATEAAVATS